MRGLLLVIVFFVSAPASAQVTVDTVPVEDDKQFLETSKFFADNKIALNYVAPPKGFTLYYNCDSMLFMRGDFGDTIRIWTPGVESRFELTDFIELMRSPEYGVRIFAKNIFSDGAIWVASYMQTQFIHRNDSLFQWEDTISLPEEYYELDALQMQGLIDDSTYRWKQDSIEKIYEGREAFVSRLIYAKGMFPGARKKVKLSKKVNYLGDEIVLEKEWMENGKKCFLLRINNRWKEYDTSYAYALNEDMEFVWWQGSKRKNKKP